MNYSAMIENRKSVRAFEEKPVPASALEELRRFYDTGCHRLVADLPTELLILDSEGAAGLAGAAGYQEQLVGAPRYLVLLSAPHAHAAMNAGCIMEDLILRLEELELQSCWITFTDSDRVKKALGLRSPLQVAAIAAFGWGKKTRRKLRFNILSMSNVDIQAQRAYFAPKKEIRELVSLNTLDSTAGLDEVIGFYEDMLWQAFYSASKAPSYLNRQPYGFLIRGNALMLVALPDDYTDPESLGLDLGIVLLHFAAVAEQWVGKISWELDGLQAPELPRGCTLAARWQMK